MIEVVIVEDVRTGAKTKLEPRLGNNRGCSSRNCRYLHQKDGAHGHQ